MWSVATTTCNGILSGTSEKGREMHLLSVIGIVPSCPTIRYGRWRKHTQRKGNISGIQQPGSRLKREIRNDLPSSLLPHQLPDVVLHVVSQCLGDLIPPPWQDVILGLCKVMCSCCTSVGILEFLLVGRLSCHCSTNKEC